MNETRTRDKESAVAAHADDLARIIPMLGLVDLEEFWERVRQAGPERLRDAVVAFRADGDLTRFRSSLEPAVPAGHWRSFDRVEEEIRRIWKEDECYPSATVLQRRRHYALIHAINTCHGGFNAVRVRLNVEPISVPQEQIATFEELVPILRAIESETGRFPTISDLQKRKRSSVVHAISDRFGGYRAVRQRMGLAQVRRVDGTFHKFPDVERAVRSIEARLGEFPSYEQIAAEDAGLLHAIIKHHGGMHSLRKRMGANQAKVMNGHYDSMDVVAAEVAAMRDALGRFPIATDFRDFKKTGLLTAIMRKHGGLSAVRTHMGAKLIRAPHGEWKDIDRLRQELLRIPGIPEGRLPLKTELIALRRFDLVNAIQTHHGGMSGLRAKLGYSPLTDETIRQRADALARIVPDVSDSSTEIWSAMRRRWTSRDLDAAIVEYEKDGSVDRFVQLLTP